MDKITLQDVRRTCSEVCRAYNAKGIAIVMSDEPERHGHISVLLRAWRVAAEATPRDLMAVAEIELRRYASLSKGRS